MSFGKKLLLGLVAALPLAAVAGFWLTVKGNVESALEQVAGAIAPYATVRIGDHATGLDGSVHLTQVEIQPRGMNTALPVKSIDIETPGLMYLFSRAGGDFWRDARPESLRLTATGLTLDLAGEAGNLLDQLANLTAQPEAVAFAHCGNQIQLGLRAWRDMGYNRLQIDATLEYTADLVKNTASLAIAAGSKDLAAIRAEAALSQIQAHSKSTPWLRGNISDIRVVYKDEGYLDGLKRYCAAASNIGVAEFVEAEAGDGGSVFLRQWGITPGPVLRTAYRDFLTAPDTLTLDFATPPDFKVENIGMYNAIDLVDSLGFTVSLNGKRADEQQYGFGPPREGPSQALLAARAAVEAMNRPVVRVSKATNAGIVDPPKIVFRAIPKDQLHRHIGRQVRFHVSGSSVREGLLTSIEGGIAHVQRVSGDSEMMLTIALRHVDRVEVQK